MKFILLFLFLITQQSHFALCYNDIEVTTPGVHNFQLQKDGLLYIRVPDYYQAFIFSNDDLAQNNAFYLDDKIIPLHYRNLFGIAFNSSSKILIRSVKNTQNISVFIVPFQNCNQHAFFGMSKDHIKIELTTTSINGDVRACGFSPSFVTNVNQNVTFGFQKQIISSAHIFYGLDNKVSDKSYSNTLRNSKDIEGEYSNIDFIVKELDKYIEFKQSYLSKQKKSKHRESCDIKSISNTIFNIFRKISQYNYNQINNNYTLKKDHDEETYFKQNYRKYLKLLNYVNQPLITKHNFKDYNAELMNNKRSLSSLSPGFLVSKSISSEIQSINSVNTTFYVIYDISGSDTTAEILLERELISDNVSQFDDSMLSDHFDFLLYYDKASNSFIYDNAWTNDPFLSQNSYFWKMMKWFLALVIILFSIVMVIVVVAITNFAKKRRICCFKNKNFAQEFYQDDFDTNMRYISQNRRRYRAGVNHNDLEESELETICYSPNLDDTYNTYSNKKNRNNTNGDYQYDSDSYTYEYESSDCEENIDNNLEINNNGNNENSSTETRQVIKRKKKVKRIKLRSSTASISSSPYDLDVGSCATIEEVNFSRMVPINNHDTDNIYNIEDKDDSTPNPYGLPSLSFDLNNAPSDDSETPNHPYPPIC